MEQAHHKRGGSYTFEQMEQDAIARAQAAAKPNEKPADTALGAAKTLPRDKTD